MFRAPMKADLVFLKARTKSGGKRFKRTKKKVEFELTDEDLKYLKVYMHVMIYKYIIILWI